MANPWKYHIKGWGAVFHEGNIAEDTPEDFVFSVKAPRYITHVRRLREIDEPLANFFVADAMFLPWFVLAIAAPARRATSIARSVASALEKSMTTWALPGMIAARSCVIGTAAPRRSSLAQGLLALAESFRLSVTLHGL